MHNMNISIFFSVLCYYNKAGEWNYLHKARYIRVTKHRWLQNHPVIRGKITCTDHRIVAPVVHRLVVRLRHSLAANQTTQKNAAHPETDTKITVQISVNSSSKTDDLQLAKRQIRSKLHNCGLKGRTSRDRDGDDGCDGRGRDHEDGS